MNTWREHAKLLARQSRLVRKGVSMLLHRSMGAAFATWQQSAAHAAHSAMVVDAENAAVCHTKGAAYRDFAGLVRGGTAGAWYCCGRLRLDEL